MLSFRHTSQLLTRLLRLVKYTSAITDAVNTRITNIANTPAITAAAMVPLSSPFGSVTKAT